MSLTREQAKAFAASAREQGYSDEEIVGKLREVGVAEAAPATGILSQGIVPDTAPMAPVSQSSQRFTSLIPVFLSAAKGTFVDTARLSAESVLNPESIFRMLYGPESADFQKQPAAAVADQFGLSTPTVEFWRSFDPIRLGEGIVTGASDMVNDVFRLVSPVVFRTTNPLSWSNLQPKMLSTDEQKAIAQHLTDTIFGMTGYTPWSAIAKTFASEGAQGVLQVLADNPEITQGALLPLAFLAGDLLNQHGQAVAFDTKLKADIARQDVRLKGEAARAQLLADTKAFAGDQHGPATALAVRLLTRLDKDGTISFRPLDQGLREELGIRPRGEGGIITPDEVSRDLQLNRLEGLLNRAALEGRGPVQPSAPDMSANAIRRGLARQTAEQPPVAPRGFAPAESAFLQGLQFERTKAGTPPESVEQIQLTKGQAGMKFEARPQPARLDRFGNPIGPVRGFAEPVAVPPTRPTGEVPDNILRVVEAATADLPTLAEREAGVAQRQAEIRAAEIIKARGVPASTTLQPVSPEVAARVRPLLVAPATYIGEQPRPGGKPPLALYNLTEDIPDHPAGSTVSDQTLTAAGYKLPPSTLAPASPPAAIEVLQAAIRDASSSTLRDPLTTEEAHAIGQIIAKADERALRRVTGAVRAATALGDRSLLRDSLRKLASAVDQPQKPRGPLAQKLIDSKAPLRGVDAIPEMPEPVTDAATLKAILSQMDMDAAAIDTAFNRSLRRSGDMGLPFFNDTAAEISPVAAPKPGGVVMRVAGGIPGVNALYDGAAARGLTIARNGTTFTLNSPAGVVAQSDSMLHIADAIDGYVPAPGPTIPKAPFPKRTSTDAEFLGLQSLAELAERNYHRLLEPVFRGRMSPEAYHDALNERRSLLFDAFLHTRTATQSSKLLRGVAQSPFALPGEAAGDFMIGTMMKANAALITDEGRLRALGEDLKAVGYRGEEGFIFGRKGAARGDAAGDILDTFITSAQIENPDGLSEWTSVVDSKTPASALRAHEGVPADQIRRAGKAWDALTQPQRQRLLTTRVWLDQTFDRVQQSEVKTDFYKFINAEGVPRQPPGVSPVRASVEGAIQTQPRARPPRWRIGPRLEAYATHAISDNIRDKVMGSAMDLAPASVQRFLSTDLLAAMKASPRAPFTPTDAPNMRLTSPVEALRHLMPGADNNALGKFMREGFAAVEAAGGAPDRVMRVLPTNLFSRFLTARRAEGRPPRINIIKFIEAYGQSVLPKIHFDPAYEKIRPVLENILDPGLQSHYIETIANIIGKKAPASPGVRWTERKLNFVIRRMYDGLIIGKPAMALINLTQGPIYQTSELGVKNYAASQMLLAQPGYWSWLLDNQMIQESMPLDFYIRSTRAASFKEAFAAPRAFEAAIDSFKRMREARTFASARAAVDDAITAGFSPANFMSMVETYNRASTIAHSLVNTYDRAGVRDAFLGGRSDIGAQMLSNPLLAEHAMRKALIDSGNVNGYSGRGANAAFWQGQIQRSKYGGLARPLFMLSSFPTLSFAALTQHLYDAAKGDTPAIRRRGAIALGTALTAMTVIAGPRAVGFWIKRIDEDASAKGSLLAFFRTWEDKYSVAGRLGAFADKPARDLASRTGIIQADPTGGIAGELATRVVTGDYRGGRLGSSKPVLRLGEDLLIAASAGVAKTMGGSPTQEQIDAIQRLTGSIFAPDWVNKPAGMLPPDLAMLLPAGDAARQWIDIQQAYVTEQARPGAQLDEKGRPLIVRDFTEQVLRQFAGGSVAEEAERSLTGELSRQSAELERLKQIAIRSFPGTRQGDTKRYVAAVSAIHEKFPTFTWTPDEIRTAVKDESLKQYYTKLERQMLFDLDEATASKAAMAAWSQLQNAGAPSETGPTKVPLPEELQRAAVIVSMWQLRQARKRK